MHHELRIVGVLIGSALFGCLAMSSTGLSQELSVESSSIGTSGELTRQTKTSGELPAASSFQELNAGEEPPLPYIEPAPKKPVVATKPVVAPVTVEPEPKVKTRPAKKTTKPKKTAKKVATAPPPQKSKTRVIPVEEIPIVGIEVVSDTEEQTTPQTSESRKTNQIDRN